MAKAKPAKRKPAKPKGKASTSPAGRKAKAPAGAGRRPGKKGAAKTGGTRKAKPGPAWDDTPGALAHGNPQAAEVSLMEADIGLVTLDDDLPMVTLAEEEELQGEQVHGQEAPPQAERTVKLAGPWSLPEQFLLVALREGWDDRMEKLHVQGAAIAASMFLELVVRDRVRIHLDRLQIVGEPTGDMDLDAFAREVEALSTVKAPVALEKLGRRSRDLVDPWRLRLQERGVVEVQKWRFLGLFHRSRTLIMDAEAKAKMENRLQRTLVGGTPDVRTILLLALIDAAGLLPEIIPPGALAYNRRRITALLAGRDTLGYRVDPAIHGLQSVLVNMTLQTVRDLQGVR